MSDWWRNVRDQVWRAIAIHYSPITIHFKYGRSRRQTACANFAWTRLDFFQRSPEDFRKPSRWRRDFAQRRQGPFDRKRDLQFQIADRGAPFFAPAAGPRPRFLQTPDRAC